MSIAKEVERLQQQRAAQAKRTEEEARKEKQRQQLELKARRTENFASFQAFLNRTGLRENLEELQKVKHPDGEILINLLKKDASFIKMSLRWPIKWVADVSEEGAKLYGVKRVKYPTGFHYVSIFWDENGWVDVDGEKIEERLREGELSDEELRQRLLKGIARAYLDPGWETGIQVSQKSGVL